jgi:hypothetical protein
MGTTKFFDIAQHTIHSDGTRECLSEMREQPSARSSLISQMISEIHFSHWVRLKQRPLNIPLFVKVAEM